MQTWIILFFIEIAEHRLAINKLLLIASVEWPTFPLSSGNNAGVINFFTGLRLSEKQVQREHRHLPDRSFI